MTSAKKSKRNKINFIIVMSIYILQIRNEFLREYACASKACSNGMRQLTCIYR